LETSFLVHQPPGGAILRTGTLRESEAIRGAWAVPDAGRSRAAVPGERRSLHAIAALTAMLVY